MSTNSTNRKVVQTDDPTSEKSLSTLSTLSTGVSKAGGVVADREETSSMGPSRRPYARVMRTSLSL